MRGNKIGGPLLSWATYPLITNTTKYMATLSFHKIIIKHRLRQVFVRISYKGNDLLRCDIAKDVRPFKWPKRRKPATQEEIAQPMLFNEQIQMPRGPCDECHKDIIEYNYTSLALWNQVADWRERICSNCFAKLHKRRDNDWL